MDLCVIGCGWAARELHVPALRRSGAGRIVAAYDPIPKARESVGAGAAYDDWRRMLQEVRYDAVLIASPPSHHAEAAVYALETGRHVMLEKPVAASIDDSRRIQDAARASGRIAAVGFNQRCHPALRRVRERIASGAFGSVEAVHVRWSTGAGLGAREWIGERDRGGGCLLDLGSHIVDLWRYLLGGIERLTAEADASTVDDGSAVLRGRASSGASLQADLSITGGDIFEIQVRGSKTSARIHPYGRGMAASYDEQWRTFARAIAGDGQPAANLEDGVASLEWVLRASASCPVRTSTPRPEERFPLSVISSTTVGYAAVRTTVAHLRRQTEAHRIELILVGPTEESLAAPHDELAGFAGVVRVATGPVRSIAHANAAGVRRARGRVVALTEDHCFPEPEWAAALIAAHEDDCAVVGPAVRNGNPATRVSQADFIIGYGPWMEPIAPREMPFLPGHNSSYKRDDLLALGGRLERLMEAETVLHMEWSSQGKRLKVEPRARVRHMNYSLWRSWIPVQVLAGRVFGGMRAASWPRRRQLFYAAASPLIPAVRFWRSMRDVLRRGGAASACAVAPALAVGLALDGVGQFLGYLWGPGDAMEALCRYEFNRVQHVRPEERSLWTSP